MPSLCSRDPHVLLNQVWVEGELCFYVVQDDREKEKFVLRMGECGVFRDLGVEEGKLGSGGLGMPIPLSGQKSSTGGRASVDGRLLSLAKTQSEMPPFAIQWPGLALRVSPVHPHCAPPLGWKEGRV